ncbi:MAG: hypothetical protein SGI91_04300 [Alphaproteobacteria bacterium]|nr:hypothetical protein [Alphaproteobacteria bacterium]
MLRFSNAYGSGFNVAGSQRSLLGRPVRRLAPGAASSDYAHEEDEAVASKETREKMREFISAWNTAGDSEQAQILGELVFNWRGDNAAGGLPVHAHNPLPSEFARTIAGLAAQEGKQPALEEAVAKLDPPIRTSVVRQIYDWTQRRDQALHGNRMGVERGPTVGQALRDAIRVGTTSPLEDAWSEIDGGSIGGKAFPLAAPSSGRIYSEYNRPAGSPPAPQNPYQPRSRTQDDARLDRVPESEGGPKDDFRTTTKVTLRDPRGLDLKPFDPRAGYYDRLARRADELRRRGLVPRRGVDIDGRPYDSLLRVGTDKGSLRVTSLTPRGVEEVMRLFADEVHTFETVDQAVAYFASVYNAFGDPLSRAELAGLRRGFSSALAVAVGIPNRGAKSDRTQAIIVINENLRRFRDPRSGVPAEEQDAEALAHEIGHIISDVMGLGERLSALPAGDRLQVGQELNRAFTGQRGLPGQFDDSARNPEEWIAEFFVLYLLDPERAKREAPVTAAIIRKWWNENPEVNRTLIFSKATQGDSGLA